MQRCCDSSAPSTVGTHKHQHLMTKAFFTGKCEGKEKLKRGGGVYAYIGTYFYFVNDIIPRRKYMKKNKTKTFHTLL